MRAVEQPTVHDDLAARQAVHANVGRTHHGDVPLPALRPLVPFERVRNHLVDDRCARASRAHQRRRTDGCACSAPYAIWLNSSAACASSIGDGIRLRNTQIAAVTQLVARAVWRPSASRLWAPAPAGDDVARRRLCALREADGCGELARATASAAACSRRDYQSAHCSRPAVLMRRAGVRGRRSGFRRGRCRSGCRRQQPFAALSDVPARHLLPVAGRCSGGRRAPGLGWRSQRRRARQLLTTATADQTHKPPTADPQRCREARLGQHRATGRPRRAPKRIAVLRNAPSRRSLHGAMRNRSSMPGTANAVQTMK